MSETIPESHVELIAGPIYSTLTTIAPDGIPENTVIWCSWDGSYVLVNTRRNSRKIRNIEKNPKVALTAIDPKNAYNWIDVRGTVTDITTDVDYKNINSHAKIYRGEDEYYGGVAPLELKGRDERVIIRIKPERVVAYAPRN
jgi:PPOX class probable F420-dependent enzyme